MVARRRLLGLMLGAPPALAASAALAATPEDAPDSVAYVQPVRFHHRMGEVGFGLNATRRNSEGGWQQRSTHVCQCANCTPRLAVPEVKVLSRTWIPMEADEGNYIEGFWREEYEPLHNGHFGVRFNRPSYDDHRNGIRLAVIVNGFPVPSGDMFEVLAGPNGGVWTYTNIHGRHSCLTCSMHACTTVYRGETVVSVLVPDHVTPDPPLRSLFA